MKNPFSNYMIITQLEEINIPSWDNETQIKNAKEFKSLLNKKLENNKLIPNSSPEKIGLIISYNDKNPDLNVKILKRQICIDQKQDFRLTLFRAELNNILSKFEEFIKSQKIGIYLLYLNKEEDVLTCFKSLTDVNKSQTSEDISFKIDSINPIFCIDQLIVNEKVKNELENTISLIENRHRIYSEWGFSKVEPIPHCVINLFGPPGTGKTMSAHILAKELNLKILPLNYADIESKYVGDAPKKLIAAFNIAEKQNALLFFDEADSFLGKRITNVNASSDQAINSLRSQLLILLESRNVITVFATNLIENYDSAFHSRILKSIKFELPDIDTRKKIIEMMIPNEVPLDSIYRTEEFFTELSILTENFSPREIKNNILNVLIEGCKKGITPLLFKDVFQKQKEIFDSIKFSKKNEITDKVKKIIADKNYNVVSREE